MRVLIAGGILMGLASLAFIISHLYVVLIVAAVIGLFGMMDIQKNSKGDLIAPYNGAHPAMGKLAAFAGVHKFPARVKCAILSWHAAKAAVEGGAETVSTEGDADEK